MLIVRHPPTEGLLRQRLTAAREDVGPLRWWPVVSPPVLMVVELVFVLGGVSLSESRGWSPVLGAAVGVIGPVVVLPVGQVLVHGFRTVAALVRGPHMRPASPITLSIEVAKTNSAPSGARSHSAHDSGSEDLETAFDGWSSRAVSLVVDNRSPYVLRNFQLVALGQGERIGEELEPPKDVDAFPPWGRLRVRLYSEHEQVSRYHPPFGGQPVIVGRAFNGLAPEAVEARAAGIPPVSVAVPPPEFDRRAPRGPSA